MDEKYTVWSDEKYTLEHEMNSKHIYDTLNHVGQSYIM